MPGPIALIALAARLGIPKAAKLVAEKGVKFLQKRIRQAQKQKTKKQEATGKKFTKKGSQRKQEKATQRKKPKVDSGLEIKKSTDTLGRKIYRGEERKKHQGYIKDVVQPLRRKAKQEAEAKKVGGIKELRQIRKEAKLRKRNENNRQES